MQRIFRIPPPHVPKKISSFHFYKRNLTCDFLRQFKSVAVIGLCAIAFVHQHARAQTVSAGLSPPPIKEVESCKEVRAVLTQFKVAKAADGSEKLEDASTVKPGDVIEYKVTYTNNGTKPVSGLMASLPIPEGLEYLPRSAKPAADLLKVATRDGNFGSEPLIRTLGGKTENVPYVEYRHLRWNLGKLPANGSLAVSARAKVETVVPVVPKISNAAMQKIPGYGAVNSQPK